MNKSLDDTVTKLAFSYVNHKIYIYIYTHCQSHPVFAKSNLSFQPTNASQQKRRRAEIGG
jgi:hypothetical protein